MPPLAQALRSLGVSARAAASKLRRTTRRKPSTVAPLPSDGPSESWEGATWTVVPAAPSHRPEKLGRCAEVGAALSTPESSTGGSRTLCDTAIRSSMRSSSADESRAAPYGCATLAWTVAFDGLMFGDNPRFRDTETDSLMLSESDSLEPSDCFADDTTSEVSEVEAMLSTLPPVAPGLPSALVVETNEFDGEWEMCNRHLSAPGRFDRVVISQGQLRTETGERHFLQYTRKGPKLMGGAIDRRNDALVWQDPAGVRVYMRSGPCAAPRLSPPMVGCQRWFPPYACLRGSHPTPRCTARFLDLGTALTEPRVVARIALSPGPPWSRTTSSEESGAA